MHQSLEALVQFSTVAKKKKKELKGKKTENIIILPYTSFCLHVKDCVDM